MSLMLDEIAEQPAALERTLAGQLETAGRLRAHFGANRPDFVVLVARGTSDNAALFYRYLLEIEAGLPVSLAAPSVTTLYDATPAWKNALVVGVSQSGEGTDINRILESAKAGGARTLGVTNESESAMAKVVDDLLLVEAGRERSVAATKTYTGQLIAGYLLAYALGAPVDLDKLRALPGAAAAALETESAVADLAERYRFMEQCVVVGRGLNYGNAYEFALKMMETSYVVAERFSGADLAHGPIAMVEQDFPAFLFALPGPAFAGALELGNRLRSLGAETVILSPESDLDGAAVRQMQLPATPEGSPADLYTPIPAIVPAQLFAAHLAEHKGLDPDNPRALKKVTRTL